jgi:hypothetical protein
MQRKVNAGKKTRLRSKVKAATLILARFFGDK